MLFRNKNAYYNLYINYRYGIFILKLNIDEKYNVNNGRSIPYDI